MRHLLLALAPSHYCERARWALDRAGVAYDEERLAPGPHVARTKRLGLTGSGLPILLPADGDPIQGSARILDWTGLTAGGDVEVERRLEDETAPLVRRCAYAGLLNMPGSGVRAALMRGVVGRQRSIGQALWPVTRRLMIRGMSTRASLTPELIAGVDRELDWFEGVLAERGEHLVGTAFGRADLTAASLLAPVALPPTPPLSDLYAGLSFPPMLSDALARWAERPSILWVRRIYATHRIAAS